MFAMICVEQPNLLLLDELTNHLDNEAITAKAINAYQGGRSSSRTISAPGLGGEGDLGMRTGRSHRVEG